MIVPSIVSTRPSSNFDPRSPHHRFVYIDCRPADPDRGSSTGLDINVRRIKSSARLDELHRTLGPSVYRRRANANTSRAARLAGVFPVRLVVRSGKQSRTNTRRQGSSIDRRSLNHRLSTNTLPPIS